MVLTPNGNSIPTIEHVQAQGERRRAHTELVEVAPLSLSKCNAPRGVKPGPCVNGDESAKGGKVQWEKYISIDPRTTFPPRQPAPPSLPSAANAQNSTPAAAQRPRI